nr:MAG TPA: hypothetical protein [Caudoviricetes sp.]
MEVLTGSYKILEKIVKCLFIRLAGSGFPPMVS